MLRLLTGLTFPGAPSPELQMQQAGFDLTVKAISRFDSIGSLDLTNEQRVLPELVEQPFPADGSPNFLQAGGYLVTYNEEIGVPARSVTSIRNSTSTGGLTSTLTVCGRQFPAASAIANSI